MPQFIEFEIDGKRVGTLQAGHLPNPGTTWYRVWWCTDAGWIDFGGFNTGIECQPCQQCRPRDSKTDMACDFTHARRAIAGVASAADNICETIPDQGTKPESVQLHLRTNGFYRGMVTIQPDDNGGFMLTVKIGGFIGCVQKADRPTRFEASKPVPKPNCNTLRAAFQVIKSERGWLLDILEARVWRKGEQSGGE